MEGELDALQKVIRFADRIIKLDKSTPCSIFFLEMCDEYGPIVTAHLETEKDNVSGSA